MEPDMHDAQIPRSRASEQTVETSEDLDLHILIADDHDLVRETLAAFLQRERIATVAVASDLDEALAAVGGGDGFDLVLLDYEMPGMNGLDGLARMREATGGRPVAILSGTASRAIAEEAIESGAAGFVPKTMGSRSMATAVRFMASGEVYVPFQFLQQQDPVPTSGGLSRRETEVLRGICEGKSNKEIARDLSLQEVTIKLHVKTLSRKLDARNRTHAAMIARDRKLV